jgi:hypothetical protein
VQLSVTKHNNGDISEFGMVVRLSRWFFVEHISPYVAQLNVAKIATIIVMILVPSFCATYSKFGSFPASFFSFIFHQFSNTIQYYHVIICPLVMLPYPHRVQLWNSPISTTWMTHSTIERNRRESIFCMHFCCLLCYFNLTWVFNKPASACLLEDLAGTEATEQMN